MEKLPELQKKSDQISIQDELLSAVTSGIFAFAAEDGRVLSINGKAREIMGISDGEADFCAYKTFTEAKIMPEDREDFRIAVDSLKSVGDKTNITFSTGTLNDVSHIKANIERLRLSDGTECILFTMLDITEHKRYVDALERDRINYCQALTSGSEYSFTFDLTTGIITQNFAMSHKLDLLKILGITIPASYDLVHEKYIDIFKIEFMKPETAKYFTCAGLREAYENGENNVIIEYVCTKTNISLRAKVTMYHEHNTNHIFAFVVASNTTEARKKELEQSEALRQALEKLSNTRPDSSIGSDEILDSISDGFRIIDNSTNGYVYVSPKAARLQGYSREEFMERFGEHVTKNMYPPDRQNAFAEAFAQANENEAFQVKYRIEDKDGNIKWVLDRGTYIDGADGQHLCYSVLQDITELEARNERLLYTLDMQEHVANSVTTGIFAYTVPQRRILLINQAIKDMYGYTGSNAEQLGHQLMDRVDAKDKPIMVNSVRSLQKPGDSTEYVFHSTKADGTPITLKSRTKLLSFRNGQRFILSAMTDYTQQEMEAGKQMTEHIKADDIITGDGEIFFTVDLSEGMCSDPIISESGEKLFKYFGTSMPSRYDDLARIFFGSGKTVPISSNTDLFLSCEKLIKQHKNGISRIKSEFRIPELGKYYCVTFLLSKLSSGNIHASVLFYDITADKKPKSHSRTVIESLGQAYSSIYYISLRDKQYIAIKQNNDMDDKLPESGNLSTIIKTFIDEFVLPTHRDEMEDFFNVNTISDRMKDSNVLTIEYRRRDIGWCRGLIAAAERDGDKVTAVVYAAYVIEANKQEELARIDALRDAYEESVRANRSKATFLENMSRDLRTPMNSIIGMAAIAETHIDDKERVSDCLTKINMSSKQLIGLMDEILDMSKIETDTLELREEFFNLPEFIDNLITLSQPEINAKKHELTVNVNGIEHENVVGDGLRLQQVFNHLLGNSIKYTPDGGKITLTVSEKPAPNPTLGCYEFVFTDNGFGIDEEFLNRIFEPFSRSNDKRISSIQGTGLGMSITRNIVRLMDGDLKVQSKLNEGTTVTVTICLKTENDSFSSFDDRFKGIKVLIADTDDANCTTGCEMLTELGMSCDWVTDGSTAIEKVLERHSVGDDYFAVVLDRKLAGINGIAATKEIRSRIPGKMPNIILSAFDRSDIEVEARAAGVNAFISKPVFKSRVIHLFNELIGYGTSERKAPVLSEIKAENFSGKRALLVEDDELNAEIAGEIISLAGLKVDYASTGKEALDMIANAEDDYYNIVFMDIQMPEMNGYDASRAIRALPGGYPKRVPIIAMTASAFAEDIAAAKGAGMNEHIAKPIDFDKLLMVLKKWLE